jgi:ribosomal protein S18 acetylase RimI-like enzyme
MTVRIVRMSEADLDDAWAILEEYQNFTQAVLRDDSSTLAGYLRPSAGFWLAVRDGGIRGCIALRPLDENLHACEIKRLYVQPAHRGLGIADQLLAALEAYAASFGYRYAYLDTLLSLGAAIRFYERHGFVQCDRYNDNPQAELFMMKPLG